VKQKGTHKHEFVIISKNLNKNLTLRAKLLKLGYGITENIVIDIKDNGYLKEDLNKLGVKLKGVSETFTFEDIGKYSTIRDYSISEIRSIEHLSKQ